MAEGSACPAASIIISVHDGEQFIIRAVDSALAQTLGDIEVIVVDDASTDRTPDLIARAALRDARVKPLLLTRNLGPSAARNRGLDIARGRWVAILDADDWFLPGRLATLIARAEAAGADLISDDLLLHDEEADAPAGPMFGAEPLPPVIDAAAFVWGNLPDPRQPRRGLGFLKPLMRRDFLERQGLRYPESMRFAEDYAFYLAALMAGGRWIAAREAGYVYAVRGASLTATHRAEDLFRLCKVDAAALAMPDLDPPLRAALRAHLLSVQKRAAWAGFIDAFKVGSLRKLMRTATINPKVFAFVAARCLEQARLRWLSRIGRRGSGMSEPRPASRSLSGGSPPAPCG